MADRSTSHWPITLTNGVAAVFNIFLPLGLVRILSPDQVGRYQVFFLYVMLCPGLFLTAGLTNGLYHWVGKYPESKPEVRQSWTLLILISLAVCVVGLISSRWLAPLLKIPSTEMQLVLISAPLVLGSSFLEDLMIARGDVWTGSLYASGFSLFRAASILATAWWTRSVMWVFAVFIGVIGLRAIAGWLLLSKTGEIEFIFSRQKAVNVLRYALPVSLAALAVLALANADQMILSFRLSPAKFALYALGCLSLPPLDIFESSVNRILIPKLSKAFTANDHAEAGMLFSDAVSELFRFLLPATLGLMIYSKPIIWVLFTQRYLASAQYLRIYALVFVFWSFPFDAVARARGDGRWILRMSLIFAPLSLAATWLAAGRWGAIGALVAVVTCKCAMRVYSLTYDRRWIGASFAEFLPLKDIGMYSVLAFAAASVSLLLRPLYSDPRTWFLYTGPLFTLLYFGAGYAVNLRRVYANLGPIRVLELTQTLGLGGLERTVYSLAEMLNKRWHFKVLVAAYDHAEGEASLAAQFQESGIPLLQWQKGKGVSLRNVFRLVKIIFAEKTRIVHAHDLGPLIYGSLAKLLSLGRVRLVLTLHTLLDIQQNPKYRFYYKLFLRFPDRIIAVSPGVQSGLVSLGVKPGRIEVIPNGVSFSLSPVRLKDPAQRLSMRRRILPGRSPELYAARWILCLARLHPGKGQEVALDVWSALPENARAELGLFFVGQETDAGYAGSLRQRIQNLPDRQRIVLAGPSEHPQDWIQCADLFISGSHLEGMPLAPLEAAGSGLPVLLSDIEGHRFLEPWARYFDPGKPADGARKIQEILEAMKRDGDVKFFEDRWNAASPLRERWGAGAMTASYAEAFESA